MDKTVQLQDGTTLSMSEYKDSHLDRLKEANPQPETLDELKAIYRRHLKIDPVDDEIIDVILAAACDRRIPGDPAWLFLVGASGCFKTEILRSLSDIPEIYTVDSLTGQTLISGKVEKNERGEYEPIAGILKHLDNRILTVKDFTTVLSMKEESRQQILGDLRAAHDGYLEKAYGTLEHPIRIKATFGLIAAVTPAIDKYVKTAVTLGERFLKIRTHGDERINISRRALSNMGHETQMRESMKRAAANYIKSLDFDTPITVPQNYKENIIHMALYAAHTRAHVWANFYRGNIIYMEPPDIEYPTRISKQLYKIGKLLCTIRGKTAYGEEEHATLTRIAKDCGLPERQKIIDYLIEKPTEYEASTNEIAETINANWNTAHANLEKMTALKIIKPNREITVTNSDEGTRYNYGPESWTLDTDFRQVIEDARLYLTPPEGTAQTDLYNIPKLPSVGVRYKQPLENP